MVWVPIIVVINFCVHDVVEARMDVTLAPTNQIDDTKNSGTGSDDVRCTTIDDVIAARRSLCPVDCRCLPLEGQDVATKLIINCSGTQFNDPTSARLGQQLAQVLLRCESELTELNITNTPLTGISEVLCRLSKLRSLDLSGNRIKSLPSNCFTHMSNLTSFKADYNRLRVLQVRCRNSELRPLF